MIDAEKKAVLLVVDGWGLSPKWSGNAIKMNKLENFDRLSKKYPFFILDSELKNDSYLSPAVCNARISSGTAVVSDEAIVKKSICDIANNVVFGNIVDQCRSHGTVLHLIGTLDKNNYYSSLDNLDKLLQAAKDKHIYEVFIHIIVKSQEKSRSILPRLRELDKIIANNGIGKLMSVSGSDYLSKEGINFQTNEVFKAIAGGKAEKSLDFTVAINNYYKQGHFDNDLPPTIASGRSGTSGRINDFDGLLFFDTKDFFTKKLLFMFSSSSLKGKTNNPCYLKIAKFIENDSNDKSMCDILFEREPIANCLPQIMSDHGLEQIYITEMISAYETTKGFSGFYEKPYPGCKWQIVSSVDETKIDVTPQLSISTVADNTFKAIKKNFYDFIMVEIPNADIFAHLGAINNASNAVLLIDKFIGYLEKVCLDEKYSLFITSNHGGCEEIKSSERYRSDAHPNNPIPLVIVDERLMNIPSPELLTGVMNPKHSCFDLAPTLLRFFNIQSPSTMLGEALIK